MTLEDRRANPGTGEDHTQALLWPKSHPASSSFPATQSILHKHGHMVVSLVTQENSEQAGQLRDSREGSPDRVGVWSSDLSTAEVTGSLCLCLDPGTHPALSHKGHSRQWLGKESSSSVHLSPHPFVTPTAENMSGARGREVQGSARPL